MRILALILSLTLLAAGAQAADLRVADGSGKLWSGKGGGSSNSGKLWSGDDGDDSGLIRRDRKKTRRARGASSEVTRNDEARKRRPRRPWYRRYRRDTPVRIIERDADRDPPAPSEPEAAPEIPETTEEVIWEAPSPSGEVVRKTARGRSSPKDWVLGEPLPRGIPHVNLAPGIYDLPRPPRGQIYVRVHGEVLLIDAATRRVISAVTD